MYDCQVTMLSSIPMASTSRTRNPRGQGERLRASLLDAARDLLLELGDQTKLSVRAVTARAGVSPNALYLHFADKDELLNTVLEAAYGELRAFLKVAAHSKEDPVERLRAFALAYLEFAAQRPGIYRVLFMTKLREGVPMPEPGGAPGQDEGVDTFSDLLALVTACDPGGADQFTRSAELWAGLHGYVALRQVMPAFPWPSDTGYVERLIEMHIGGASRDDD
jgi:AcrR family transcriptional regulator